MFLCVFQCFFGFLLFFYLSFSLIGEVWRGCGEILLADREVKYIYSSQPLEVKFILT